MDKIILASSSPRRKELLDQAGIPFTVMPSSVDESSVKLSGTPEKMAEQLAHAKALDIAEKLTGGIVVGADTIVVCDDEVFGKPIDDDDAFRMLKKLNGREHFVITGVSVINAADGYEKTAHEKTKVMFAKLSDGEILSYIHTGEPRGKAGAYAVQGKGALLVKGIEGCYSNVVGLPLRKLSDMLSIFNINVITEVW
jgi:septum formation protein